MKKLLTTLQVVLVSTLIFLAFIFYQITLPLYQSFSPLTTLRNSLFTDLHAATGPSQRVDAVIVAAGDIACGASNKNLPCKQDATAKVISNLLPKPQAVLVLGDNQYEDGTLKSYTDYYAKSWGKFKNITRPVPGNHEYNTSKAKGYYDYFGKAAGDPSKGYYSYDVGRWHIIALNSNCKAVGGCQKGSPQETWLRNDLDKYAKKCTLAYWHHPRFSSGEHGSDAQYTDFWTDLYKYNVEIVLNGHDHHYERFAPQNPQGKKDSQRGIREFVVGTGGKSHYKTTKTIANSEVKNDSTFGVLKLVLHPNSYEWKFMPTAGEKFTDSGKTNCH